jgi:hypothetical protein
MKKVKKEIDEGRNGDVHARGREEAENEVNEAM